MNRGGHAGEDVIHPEGDKSEKGEDGTISGIDCPPGLYGIFCEVCNLFAVLFKCVSSVIAARDFG